MDENRQKVLFDEIVSLIRETISMNSILCQFLAFYNYHLTLLKITRSNYGQKSDFMDKKAIFDEIVSVIRETCSSYSNFSIFGHLQPKFDLFEDNKMAVN